MSKNTGIPYEVLTRDIFNQIVNKDSINNIAIQHNVEIQGKDTKHQIDVYWEFEKGGITYRAIIQSKDWNSNVKKEQVLTFKAILDDLPYGTIGIMVSQKGFQIGAKEFAQKNNILLYTLRKPDIKDYSTDLKHYNIKMGIKRPYVNNCTIVLDKDWLNVNEINQDDAKITVASQKPLKVYEINNKEYNYLTTLDAYITQISFETGYDIKFIEKHFDNLFILKQDTDVSIYLKVSKITGQFGMLKQEEFIEIKNNKIIEYFLKDILQNKITTFTSAKRIIEDEEWGEQ